MPQPANKRFVMEDVATATTATLNAAINLKAPIASPTFTGTVTAGAGGITVPSGNIALTSGGITAAAQILSNSATGITNTSTTHAVQAGSSAGLNVRLGQDGTNAAVQAVNNGAYSALNVNALGGAVNLGSASTATSVLGTFTPPRGYLLVSVDKYTSSPAAFTKASYPWLRAVRIICIGGGGGAGGAAVTAAAQNAIGQAGAGGAYAETFITEAGIAALSASVTLIVGAGGTAGGAGASGGPGGDTSFGSTCVAKGGTAGAAGAATAVGSFAIGAFGIAATSSTGDIVYPGGASGVRHHMYNASVYRPMPGGNALVTQPVNAQSIVATTSAGTTPGVDCFGVGGFPGVNAASQAAAVAGGAGSAGLMIVELYA